MNRSVLPVLILALPFPHFFIIDKLPYFLRNFLDRRWRFLASLLRRIFEIKAPDKAFHQEIYNKADKYKSYNNHLLTGIVSHSTIALSFFFFILFPKTKFIPSLKFTLFQLVGITKLESPLFILFQLSGILSVSR